MRLANSIIICFITFYFAECKIFIMDKDGQVLADIVGPLNEGSGLSLLCETHDDIPSTVSWWKGSSLLDNSFSLLPKGVMRNELTLSYLDRTDLMSTLTCHASTPNASLDFEKSISLDLNLKPLDVHITTLQRPLSAGRLTTLKCQSVGSRPPAVITWWIGSRQLLNATQSTYNAITISRLTYIPLPKDYGRILSCRATNPVMNGNILEDHRVLNIQYPPQLSVSVGTPQAHIIEGDDIYFECNIDANPPITEVGWLFNGELLYTNLQAGIKVQNHSLLLHKIGRHNSGNYSCIAANAEGEGISKNIPIDVQFPPQCAFMHQTSFGVPLKESVEVRCTVEANPEIVEFFWYLNNSLRHISLKDFSINGTSSILVFTPKKNKDYGQLLCLAKNAIGQQKEACCFKITPADVPEAVTDCTVVNETTRSAIISCVPGSDGGLPQKFHLELYSMKGLEAANMNNDLPHFELESLTSGKSFIAVIYATNDWGKSNSVALTINTKPYKNSKGEMPLSLSPVLLILIFIIGVLVLVAVIIVFSAKWSLKYDQTTQETEIKWEQREFKPGHQYI